MNPRVLITACSLILACAGPAAAQPPQQPVLAANPDSALSAAIDALPGERLFLGDAVANASVQATGARVAEAQLDAAENAVRREKGIFDPELFGTADWGGADTPSSSPFAGADVLKTETVDFEAGARITTRLGTELTASMNSLRTTTNSEFAALLPEYQSFGALTLRQPLLKGFGPSARSDLDFAESNREGASARYDGSLLAVRTEVETIYWELYAAERNHAVTRLIRDRAAAFLTDTEKRARAGIVGPSAVANAEFFLTEAEQAVLDTEEQLDRLSDRLASLMGRRPQDQRYRAADDPPRDFPLVDQDSLVAVAMRLNPDLQALARDADALRALERGAVWDARPTLDLVGSLGGNGLSGTARDVFFPGDPDPVRTDIDGDRGDSREPGLGRDYPDLERGLRLRRAAGQPRRQAASATAAGRGRPGRAAAPGRPGASFEEQVRAQHRELERGQQRLEIATRGVAASIRQVEIGMLEYNNGRTTAFEVVRLAADLATAQQRYSDALVRTARAAASCAN